MSPFWAHSRAADPLQPACTIRRSSADSSVIGPAEPTSYRNVSTTRTVKNSRHDIGPRAYRPTFPMTTGRSASSCCRVCAIATFRIASVVVRSPALASSQRRNSIGSAAPVTSSHAELAAARNDPLSKLAASVVSGKQASALTRTPARRSAAISQSKFAAAANMVFDDESGESSGKLCTCHLNKESPRPKF